jgi:plastocyanin
MRGLAAVLIVGALALAGCGGDSKKSSAGGGGSAKPSVTVDIASFKFKPPTVTVKQGGTVTWMNSDTADHTATADAGGFDTGNVRRGRSVPERLMKAGTFAYHCDFHPFMKGTVVVK